MKKKGIINRKLAAELAALGHKDRFMIADAGMPIPKGVEIIDLAVVGGVPSFRQVCDAIFEEEGVEEYWLAAEIKEKNPELLSYIQGKLKDINCTYVPHTELKAMSADIKFAVRTGEFSPYPNIICSADCAF
ncbi:MAG: D-ribose pyranase [Lachnospiraceae bacterium]|nr:D-ribose pyranase [Lachnospiraceae bacterium]